MIVFYLGKSNQEETTNRDKIEKQFQNVWTKLDGVEDKLNNIQNELYKLNLLYNNSKKD